MRRAYLLIVLPAAVVGVFYFAIFHALGMEIHPAPFLGAGVAIAAALFFVLRYQRRKTRRDGGTS
jgi:hypothetical protein